MAGLTVAEVAELTGRDVSTVRRHCASGIIAGATKVGRDWSIPEAAVAAYREYQPYASLRQPRKATGRPVHRAARAFPS